MPYRYFQPMHKARRRSRKSPRATLAQREALQARMEKAFSFSFSDGMEQFRKDVSAAALEKAFRSGDYDKVREVLPLNNLGNYFDQAVAKLADTIRDSADIEQTSLPANIADNLRLTTQNKALDDYLNERTGALIQNVDESTQVMVQSAVQNAFTSGMTARDVADQIKQSIGLTDQQAQALNNFDGSDADREAYRQRLLDQRAVTIARTEISFASNQGQLACWDAAAQDGLIDPDAPKKWLVDGDPCPKICELMDGIEVPRSEPFVLPDGAQVPCPPAHPRCRCQMVLELGDNTTSNRQNYAAPYGMADDEDIDAAADILEDEA